MPQYEYECVVGHYFTRFFKSFSEAEPFIKEFPFCPVCTELNYTQVPPQATRLVSTPLQPHFYGDPAGYANPSPTKRFSTKTVSRKDGNANATG